MLDKTLKGNALIQNVRQDSRGKSINAECYVRLKNVKHPCFVKKYFLANGCNYKSVKQEH